MTDMHCANQKATKMLKELEEKAGLIERQKQGQGKPTKIYVKDFATGLHDNGPDRKIVLTHENHDSELHLKKLPKVKDLSAEYAEILAEKKKLYGEYRQVKKDMQEIQRAKYDIDLFLKSDEEQKKERVRKHNIAR